MGHENMPPVYKEHIPPPKGGTKIPTRNDKLPNGTAVPSELSNLSYDDISYHYKYRGNIHKLREFLRRVLPVASLASLQHDVVIDIEKGDTVGNEIETILSEFEIKGRRTIGLFGLYSIIMPSVPHGCAVQFIWNLFMLVASILDSQDTRGAVLLLGGLVQTTSDGSRVLQDGTTERLVVITEDYCRDRLHENSRVPGRTVERRTVSAYEKEPDQSFQPAYQNLADNSTDLPTVICEVGMSDVVSKVIFDCLTTLAGSRGKIDLSLGVDLTINNIGLTGIRLFVFDSSITTLVRFAERNQSVARFTRSKIENRLIHLRYLRDRLQAMQTREERVKYEAYVHIQPTVLPTIEYYERTRDYLMTVSGGEVTDQDIVETCRVVLENAEVIQMTRRDDDFIVTDINGEPLNGLAVKAEAFLGLLLGFEAQVTLDIATLERIFLAVAKASESENLERIPSPIPLVVTKRHISDRRYDEFVASQGTNFNREAFESDQPVMAPKVILSHLRYDTVITTAARAYRDKKNFGSRALKLASALFWFREKQKDGVEVYDLEELREASAPGGFRWARGYTNLVNGLLEIHPTTPEKREYFRRVLGRREIKDLLDIDTYRRALAQIIHDRGLTAFLEDLGEDESKAPRRLVKIMTSAV
uniref:ARAD1D49280p n=1 Tax=Blastobotrys adeninivorans TaxID=409370 RepID=A0A060TDP1_BLAAD